MMMKGIMPFSFPSSADQDPMAELDANVVPAMRYMNPNAPIVNNQRQYDNMPSGQVIDPQTYMQNTQDPNAKLIAQMLMFGTSSLPSY